MLPLCFYDVIMILLCNDYIPRIRGYTPDEIYNDILYYGTIENIIENKSIKITGDIERMREIYKMDMIIIDIDDFNNNIRTYSNVIELMIFLKKYSNIDDNTIKHRINKIYNYTSTNSSSSRTWR
jgi:hypothetical protein